MGKRDARVDAYIAQAPDFARPILTHLRALVHTAVPDVAETMKWSVPAFDYRGPLCGMAAFKAHCMFGFWRETMESGGAARRRIESLADLPSDRTLIGELRAAARLNEQGVKTARRAAPKPPVEVPAYFLAAIRKNRNALSAFEAFPPSHKREYVEWIADAKTDETRRRRIATAIEWIAEGKSRNWKYQR